MGVKKNVKYRGTRLKGDHSHIMAQPQSLPFLYINLTQKFIFCSDREVKIFEFYRARLRGTPHRGNLSFCLVLRRVSILIPKIYAIYTRDGTGQDFLDPNRLVNFKIIAGRPVSDRPGRPVFL